MFNHTTSKILIDINYVNFAWGYQNRGVIIDNSGNIYQYILNDQKIAHDLATKLKYSKKIDMVPNNLLQLIHKLATQVKETGKISLDHTAYDAGTTTYNLYIIDNKQSIQILKLGQIGDWSGQNRDQSVSQLLSILDHYKSLIWR